MNTRVTAPLLAVAVALLSPVAATASPAQRGGCTLHANAVDAPLVGPPTWFGSIRAYSGPDVSVRCYMQVNGVQVGPSVYSDGGILTQSADVTFTVNDDVVELCGEFFPGSPSSTTVCEIAIGLPFPGDEVYDLLPDVDDQYLDPLLCPLLVSTSPGIPGVIDVEPDGDVKVPAIGLVHDCPPYDEDEPQIRVRLLSMFAHVELPVVIAP